LRFSKAVRASLVGVTMVVPSSSLSFLSRTSSRALSRICCSVKTARSDVLDDLLVFFGVVRATGLKRPASP
jgi:hypothetical protein